MKKESFIHLYNNMKHADSCSTLKNLSFIGRLATLTMPANTPAISQSRAPTMMRGRLVGLRDLYPSKEETHDTS